MLAMRSATRSPWCCHRASGLAICREKSSSTYCMDPGKSLIMAIIRVAVLVQCVISCVLCICLESGCARPPESGWRWSQSLEDEFSDVLATEGADVSGVLGRRRRMVEVYYSSNPMRLEPNKPRPEGAITVGSLVTHERIREILRALQAGVDANATSTSEKASNRWIICVYDSNAKVFARFRSLDADSGVGAWRIVPGSGTGLWPAPHAREYLLALRRDSRHAR